MDASAVATGRLGGGHSAPIAIPLASLLRHDLLATDLVGIAIDALRFADGAAGWLEAQAPRPMPDTATSEITRLRANLVFIGPPEEDSDCSRFPIRWLSVAAPLSCQPTSTATLKPEARTPVTILGSLSTTALLLILFSAFILGLAKAGLKGIDLLNVTLMALVFGGKASTGIVLPLLSPPTSLRCCTTTVTRNGITSAS